jgi:hypothetical protein
LIAGPLENPIMVSEFGETVDAPVFTGTQPNGERMLDSTRCDDWTDSSGDNFTWIGVSSEVGAEWTLAAESFCGGPAAIYCFEQP